LKLLSHSPSRALVGVSALTLAAVALRLWLMLGHGPAFVGFGDSHEYVTAAAHGVFGDVQKPAGYPIFLWLVHVLSDRLTVTVLVQHALGIASGLLLYGAIKRTGAPAWLGLFPAAAVFFGGTGLLLEHSLLADTLFTFLQSLALYAAVRALGERVLRWPLLCGLTLGASFWVKTVGLSGVALMPVVLALAAPGTRRMKLRSGAVAGAATMAIVLAYPAVQAYSTGYWGYERQGAWNLYGRVATFVDCSKFSPPRGTRFLCPTEALGHRQSESFYQYARAAPAVRRYGGPARAPGKANALIERFSVAAIEHEPTRYAAAIVRGLGFYVEPRAGEGYTPLELREALRDPKGTRSIAKALAVFYAGARGNSRPSGGSDALDLYESNTRIQGPLLVAMVLAALIGAPLLRARQRAAAILFALTAILSVMLAAAGNSYDARYGYPAFGPLAAAAALGGWAIAVRLARRGRARRDRVPPARSTVQL
jgi:hypothetical protein